jgi:hypothetical protein
MVQIYPDEGLVPILLAIVANNGSGLTWALFSNNVTPTLDSVLADFTVPSGGWAERILDDTDFVFQQVALHVGTIQAPSIVYTNSTGSPKNVYGYIIFDQIGQKLRGAARFDIAPTTIINGGTQKVQAIIGDNSNEINAGIDNGTF